MEAPSVAKVVPQIAPTLLGEEDLQRVYNWVDEIPLSRPKKNISRDFADGVLFAEMVHYHFPKLIEMHNYSAANRVSQRSYNWNTLNTKALKKLGYQIHPQDIEDIVSCTPGSIERVLRTLQEKIVLAQRNGLPRAHAPAIGGDAVVDRMEQRANERAESRARQQDCVGTPGYTPERQSSAPGGGQKRPGASRQAVVGTPGVESQQAQQRRMQQEVDVELLAEKEQKISELTEMVDLMQEKIRKLEQLVRIKDSKIEALNRQITKDRPT